MDDLIERKALVDDIYNIKQTWSMDQDDYIDEMMSCIYNAPTAEAKKIVRARWKKGGLWNNHREFFCSNPKCGQSVFGADDFNFCPYCGAEMEGVSE